MDLGSGGGGLPVLDLLARPAVPDRSTVPVEYHNLGEVFSKQCGVSLPPH